MRSKCKGGPKGCAKQVLPCNRELKTPECVQRMPDAMRAECKKRLRDDFSEKGDLHAILKRMGV